jgi:phage baseplate assembly protein W
LKQKSPVNQDKIYVDLPTNFDIHPIRKDLVLLSNEDAVKRSIRNIVLTNFYERLNVTVGTNVEHQLFDLADNQTAIVVAGHIESAIRNFEPRANLLGVNVAVVPDQHSLMATISFTLINRTAPIELSVLLARVR